MSYPATAVEAFAKKDPRLNPDDLEGRWPALFRDDMQADGQNAYWYSKIYRPVRNAPEVLQAHRSFLLFRDAAAGLFLLLLGIVVWKMVEEAVPVRSVSSWSTLILAGMFVLLSQAGTAEWQSNGCKRRCSSVGS